MNKRKLLLVASALLMVAILGFGGTLAYLTDTDHATNVFTTGNVKIDLIETFDPENAKLIPGIDVNKDVVVKNVGSEPAYVRVHIAIPTLLDSGKPEFLAYANTLHFNMEKESMAEGEWNWHSTNENGPTYPGYPGNGGDFGFYTAKVEGIDYNVYVVTYESVLAKGATTATKVLDKVYLDASLDNVHITGILEELGQIKILVAAEGVQSAGFNNAYDAFDAAHKDANESDDNKIINLPKNLIEYIYTNGASEENISTDLNDN